MGMLRAEELREVLGAGPGAVLFRPDRDGISRISRSDLTGAHSGGESVIGLGSGAVVDAATNAVQTVLGCESDDCLAILLERLEPPLWDARDDGPQHFFVCPERTLRRVLDESPGAELEELSYLLLTAALERHWSVRVFNGGSPPIPSALPKATVEFIIPHRGSAAHLATCVAGATGQQHSCAVSVGLDGYGAQPAEAQRSGLPHHCKVVAYGESVGPYVIRQRLGMESHSDYLAFQDSDDYSTVDRIARQLHYAAGTQAEIVGCHELRLDTLAREVKAIRFPLDVNASLQQWKHFAQLFPTTLVSRSWFQRVGGLSTFERFGLDFQFLLRSHFNARILNLDEFCYVRRLRAESLTTSPATGLNCDRRVRLRQAWARDFQLVKAGELELSKSSLRVSPFEEEGSG